jgi:hypothetical protein
MEPGEMTLEIDNAGKFIRFEALAQAIMRSPHLPLVGEPMMKELW